MTTQPDILHLPIAEVARLYRLGELSPVDVTQLTLECIERLNPRLNAFITVTAEVALAAAQRAEQELHSGMDRGLLHGIPVALKDVVSTKGIRTSAGSRILADYIPTQDALIVRHLQKAGAVMVGKTNMLEFAYGIVHPDYGPTWNPWNFERTAGGSSGGSAAAVAAGLCYAAVGTDTGGSIRIPAAYCGVAGLKPTYGLVSLEGIIPLSWSLDHAGPIARSSADTAILLAALGGQQTPPLQPLNLNGLRLGLLVDHLEGPEMEEAVRVRFEVICKLLEQAGVILQPVSIPNVDLAYQVLLTLVAPEASTLHARWIAERPEDYAPFTRQQIELGFAIPALVYTRAQQYRRYLTTQCLTVLQEVEAILSPTAPWVAPREDPAVVSHAGAAEARRTAPFNLTGLPALTIPCGFSPAGLPIGLQIVTRPGEDTLALNIGAAVEALPAIKERTDHAA
jgi:aspartyl-tRNA(Asn)/glutamyl-tRNA(Gln) amidotransferase subunit A